MHDEAYIQKVQQMSADDSKGHHTCGDDATFSPGGFEVACLAAGGAITAVDAVLTRAVRNAYALVIPPARAGRGASVCVCVCVRGRVCVWGGGAGGSFGCWGGGKG